MDVVVLVPTGQRTALAVAVHALSATVVGMEQEGHQPYELALTNRFARWICDVNVGQDWALGHAGKVRAGTKVKGAHCVQGVGSILQRLKRDLGDLNRAAPNLDQWYSASLALIPDGSAKSGGLATGQAAAAAMTTLRLQDGSAPPQFSLPASTEPGVWQLTQIPTHPQARATVFCGPGIRKSLDLDFRREARRLPLKARLL
jgi:hypothetical protein